MQPHASDVFFISRCAVALMNQPVLITGASRGIGAAAARRFARSGHPVALLARSAAPLAALAKEITEAGGRAVALPCDIADAKAVRAAVTAAIVALGGLGIVINNAGIVDPMKKLLEVDPAEWAHSLQINLVGPMHVLQAAVPHLPRGGTVINVSSGAASMPLVGWSAYCAAKSGVTAMSQILAAEEGEARGIRVFTLMPGLIDTEMQAQIRASGINEVSNIKREDLRPVDEPARVMQWLLTPDADDLKGKAVSARDPEIRKRVGLS